MTNDELMEAASHGDQAAFGVLVERHGGRLVGWISARVGIDPSMDAEDVAQETWFRALRGAGGYHPRGEFVAWLYQIARRILGDAAKIRRRSALGHTESGSEEYDPLDAVPDSVEDAADVVERRDILRRVAGAVEYLDAGQVAVIRGVVEGESLSEIAERLEIPLGTVKSRKRLGLSRLREELVDVG